jgi:hypothetical protein
VIYEADFVGNPESRNPGIPDEASRPRGLVKPQSSERGIIINPRDRPDPTIRIISKGAIRLSSASVGSRHYRKTSGKSKGESRPVDPRLSLSAPQPERPLLPPPPPGPAGNSRPAPQVSLARLVNSRGKRATALFSPPGARLELPAPPGYGNSRPRVNNHGVTGRIFGISPARSCACCIRSAAGARVFLASPPLSPRGRAQPFIPRPDEADD